MYNRPVSKCHARVEACGTVDELSAAMGLVRAVARRGSLPPRLEAVQEDLVRLMGELATAVEDLPRYVNAGHPLVTPSLTAVLEKWIGELETPKVARKGWAMPGANLLAAALDLARTVCRRAERRVCALQEAGQLKNPEILVYLNRLSDLLWLLARQAETRRG
jgi:cob(I)alamin adenosyltransferase